MVILHVTNGDHAADGLARSGLSGDVLAWRDVLHDGPVPDDVDHASFAATRAAFLGDRQWATELEVLDDLTARDARLDGIGAADAVMLWFEPDVYDQLQLVQLLARMARRAPADRPQLTIAPADLLLGPLVPEKFVPLFVARRVITDDDLAVGLAAWTAFTAPDPRAVLDVIARLERAIGGRTYAADDRVRLPYLTSALRRVLEEYPDESSGLSRTERQICEALAGAPLSLSKLYQTAHHASESWPWLGDTSFAWYVERLSDCAQPLVTLTNGSRVVATPAVREAQGFWSRTVRLTDFGSDVVQSRADTIAVNGIDRWFGGVHVTPLSLWRWHPRLQQLVSAPR
jgi:hypothetical protein